MVAETFGNWLEIKYFYVNEDLRGQGVGSEILHRVEEEAGKRKCKYSFVNTFNFQVPDTRLRRSICAERIPLCQ